MHGGSIALQASESERERSPQVLPAVTQRIALRAGGALTPSLY